MTDEQIKQNALKYSGCSEEWFNDVSYIGESTAYDDAHSFYDGAHSRDPEIEDLKDELARVKKEKKLLSSAYKILEDKLSKIDPEWMHK